MGYIPIKIWFVPRINLYVFLLSFVTTKVYRIKNPDHTVEHMDVHAGRVSVGRDAGVVARVSECGLGDQQLASGPGLRPLGLQGDATPWRVKVHHRPALVPQHTARRRGVDVDRARETDGGAFLHVDVFRAPDARLGRCNTNRFNIISDVSRALGRAHRNLGLSLESCNTCSSSNK